MLAILLQSWLLLTGVCVTLLALVIGAQWSMATGRRVLAAVRGGVAGRVVSAPPRLHSVAGK